MVLSVHSIWHFWYRVFACVMQSRVDLRVMGYSRKYPYHTTGGILEFRGRGGFLGLEFGRHCRGRGGVMQFWIPNAWVRFQLLISRGGRWRKLCLKLLICHPFLVWKSSTNRPRMQDKDQPDRCWRSCRWVRGWVLQRASHQRGLN